MARNKGTFKFSANLEVKIAEPLDPRTRVRTLTELTDPESYPKDGNTLYLYKGLIVAVEETNDIYILKDPSNITNINSWKRLGEGSGSGEGTPGRDGKSAYEIAVSKGYKGTEEEWLKSLKGADGKSAYQLAVEQGYLGTSAEWIASLKGEAGPEGPRGIPGPKGDDGTGVNIKASKEECKVDGDAYINEQGHIMIKLGDTFKDGGEIKGPQGDSIKEVRFLKLGNTPKEHIYGVFNDKSNNIGEFKVTDGNDGGKGADGVNGKDGTNGLSAYEIAVQQGYKGDQQKWLESLKGKDGLAGPIGPQGDQGIQGYSAYQVAVNNKFKGTEEEWLASLKGDNGLSAYLIAVKDGYTGTLELWLKSLKGEIGPVGIQGPPGIPGNLGASIKNIESAGAVEGGNKYNVYTDKDSNTPIGSFIAPEGPRGLQGNPGIQGPPGDKGADGTSVKILGSLNSKDELSGKNKNQGDGYMIKGDLWVYNGNSITDSSHAHGFENVGKIQGPKGDIGSRGPQGQSITKVETIKTDDSGTEIQFYAELSKLNNTILIPRGKQGLKGDLGYSIVEVELKLNGSDGNHYNVLTNEKGVDGTNSNHKIIGEFVAPKGPTGLLGPRGLQGYTPNKVIYSSKTKSENKDGNEYLFVLNDTLETKVIGSIIAPRGEKGDPGKNGLNVKTILPDNAPYPEGNSYKLALSDETPLNGTFIAPKGDTGSIGPRGYHPYKVVYSGTEKENTDGNKYLFILNDGLETPIQLEIIAPRGPQGPSGGPGSPGKAGPRGYSITSVSANGVEAKLGNNYDIFIDKPSGSSSTTKIGSIIAPKGDPGSGGPRGPLGYSIVEVIKTKSDSQGNLYSILTNLNGTLGAQSNHTVIGTFTAPTGPLGLRGYSIVSVEDHKGSQNTTIGNSYDIYSNQPSSGGPRTLLGTIVAPLGPIGPQGPEALQIRSIRSYEVLSDIGNKYLLLLSDGSYVEGVFIAPLGPIGPIGPRGPKGDNGTSVTIKGSISRKEELDSKSLGAKIGDSYLLNGDLWVYNGNSISNDKHYKGFENVGKILGPLGEPGPEGPRGEPGLMGTFNTENLKTINGEIIIKEVGNNTIYTVGSENDNKDKHAKQINQKGEVFNDYINNLAIGPFSHTEGSKTKSRGEFSHTEGYNTEVAVSLGDLDKSGTCGHAEGDTCKVTGRAGHAENTLCEAAGRNTHAGGHQTVVNGKSSFGHGENIKTTNDNETSFGKYNANIVNQTFSVGIGTNLTRNNAFSVSNTGNFYLKGLGGYNGANKDYAGINSLLTIINNLVGNGNIENLKVEKLLRTSMVSFAGGEIYNCPQVNNLFINGAAFQNSILINLDTVLSGASIDVFIKNNKKGVIFTFNGGFTNYNSIPNIIMSSDSHKITINPSTPFHHFKFYITVNECAISY